MWRKFIVKFTVYNLLCTVLFGCPGVFSKATAQMGKDLADDLVVQCRKIVAAALAPTENWPLPPPGPPGLPDKTIAYIGEDLRNAGILGVGEGVRQGADCINWDVKFFDIGGNDANRQAIFKQAFDLRPDSLILGSIDAKAVGPFLKPFKRAGIPMVGWHVSPFPGDVPNSPILLNVATDSVDVARTAAAYVIAESNGGAKVVIFTDSHFAIAMKKADTMAQMIKGCKGCELLEIIDLPLDNVCNLMGKTTDRLLSKYDDNWEYSLAINDLYYDYAIARIVLNGNAAQGPPVNISAGDGSPSALLRIKYDSYQRATVPEPLVLQGWQLVDELNRVMNNMPPSDYKVPLKILTMENIKSHYTTLNLFDPKNGYRRAYRNIWKKN
jgi:ribose transport system substrate-binding protein